jgi:hypothetical protein
MVARLMKRASALTEIWLFFLAGSMFFYVALHEPTFDISWTIKKLVSKLYSPEQITLIKLTTLLVESTALITPSILGILFWIPQKITPKRWRDAHFKRRALIVTLVSLEMLFISLETHGKDSLTRLTAALWFGPYALTILYIKWWGWSNENIIEKVGVVFLPVLRTCMLQWAVLVLLKLW